MSRFLFVVPPLVGHVLPAVSVAAELETRGHQVAWAGHPGTIERLLQREATIFPAAPAAEVLLPEGFRPLRGAASFKFLWEGFFVPLARTMLPGVEQAVDAFEPSVLVVDQQTLAGGLVARKRGLRWATTCAMSAMLTKALERDLPKLQEWQDAQLATLEAEIGLAPVDRPDLSPALVLVFSTEALVGSVAGFDSHFAFVGPAIRHRAEKLDFPMERLRDVPRVLVHLGTVVAEADERFYQIVVDAFRDQPLQVILVVPDRFAPVVPENFIVRSFVPHLALMPHLDALVCHAGHNTVCDALAHGVPVVVMPINYDQLVTARQVTDCGAGIRLKFGRFRPEDLRQAVGQLLHEPQYAQGAARVADSFRRSGGPAEAADRLERLA